MARFSRRRVLCGLDESSVLRRQRNLSGIGEKCVCGPCVPTFSEQGSDPRTFKDEPAVGKTSRTLDACIFFGLGGQEGEVRGGSGTAWQPKPAPSPAVWSVVQVTRRSGTGEAQIPEDADLCTKDHLTTIAKSFPQCLITRSRRTGIGSLLPRGDQFAADSDLTGRPPFSARIAADAPVRGHARHCSIRVVRRGGVEVTPSVLLIGVWLVP